VKRDPNFGTTQNKLAAFQTAQVPIAESPAQIPQLLKKVIGD
jgi:succinyl-CoA synthetase alpha subunit